MEDQNNEKTGREERADVDVEKKVEPVQQNDGKELNAIQSDGAKKETRKGVIGRVLHVITGAAMSAREEFHPSSKASSSTRRQDHATSEKRKSSELENALLHLADAQQRHDELEEEAARYRQQCSNLRSDLKRKVETIRDLREGIADLENENGVLEQWRRDFQEKDFNRAHESSWPTETDDLLEKKLSALEKACQSWSRENAASQTYAFDFGDRDVEMPDAQSAPEFVSKLHFDHFLKLDSQGRPLLDLRAIPNRAPRMLLAAALSDYLYRNILTQPFYFLNHRGLDNGEEVMRTLVEEFAQGNCKQAAAWRAELMRQLCPLKRLSSKTAEQEKTIATTKENTGEAICKALAANLAEFLHMVEPLVSEASTPSNRVRVLRRIFTDAGYLSMHLWTQLRHFEVIDLKVLPETFGEAASFIPEMPHVEAHPMHTAALDDDERCMDEKQILFITSPGLVACGDSGGNDYSVRYVLKTAVAWLGHD